MRCGWLKSVAVAGLVEDGTVVQGCGGLWRVVKDCVVLGFVDACQRQQGCEGRAVEERAGLRSK